MAYYSVIKNEIMLLAGDRTGDHHVKRSKPGSERQSSRIFSHMWKIDQKDKHIHKCKYYHIYIERENMFSIVGLFDETKGRRERKENDRE
jgi:hypothetical protein